MKERPDTYHVTASILLKLSFTDGRSLRILFLTLYTLTGYEFLPLTVICYGKTGF